MHSGGIVANFSGRPALAVLFSRIFPGIYKKILDTFPILSQYRIMKRSIVKVDRRDISFRVTIPRKVILYKKWTDVEYMLLEESGPDTIVLRRLIDAEALEVDDQGHFPGFN